MTTSRWGGVSVPPYNELNVSFGVGDDPYAVRTNRVLIQEGMGCSCLVSSGQVHGDVVREVNGPLEEGALAGVDGLVIRRPGVGIMVQHADCQAVVIYDPARKVVANIHCGWKGCLAGILPKTVKILCERHGSRPGDLLAYVSPSLGPCCAEFKGWDALLPKTFHRFVLPGNRVDFWGITRWQLEGEGLSAGHIFFSGICTVCSPDLFSYRREGVTGRCGTVAFLE